MNAAEARAILIAPKFGDPQAVQAKRHLVLLAFIKEIDNDCEPFVFVYSFERIKS